MLERLAFVSWLECDKIYQDKCKKKLNIYSVINRDQLKNEIIHHFSERERIWSNEETAVICEKIAKLTNADDEIKTKHIQNIRNNQR